MPSVERDPAAVAVPSRPSFAGWLSLAIPGLGQVAQGRIGRGLTLSSLPLIALFAFCHSGALRQFGGAVILLLIELLLWMIACVDAVHRPGVNSTAPAKQRFGWAALLLLVWGMALLFPVNRVLTGDVCIFIQADDAMTPTLMPGDWVMVSLAPWTSEPLQRGEIIAYTHRGQFYARRILGLPGDTIRFQAGRVQRNGEWVTESYADLTPVAGVDPEDLLPVRVKGGELYALGDARNRSIDSHSAGYGAVQLDDVVGRAEYILWSHPLSRIGHSLQ